MEQVRDTVLDRYCESIGDTRDKINALRQDEAADTNGALRRMQQKDTNHYIHAGVELVKVPGSDKLRVRRTSKEEAEGLPVGEPADEGEFAEERRQAVEDPDPVGAEG